MDKPYKILSPREKVLRRLTHIAPVLNIIRQYVATSGHHDFGFVCSLFDSVMDQFGMIDVKPNVAFTAIPQIDHRLALDDVRNALTEIENDFEDFSKLVSLHKLETFTIDQMTYLVRSATIVHRIIERGIRDRADDDMKQWADHAAASAKPKAP